MSVEEAMRRAKFTEKDAIIAFSPEHDHMACAKCLGPRFRFIKARELYQNARTD